MSTSTTSFRHLFVYGTLLSVSKHPIAEFLRRNTQLVGPGFFPGRLYDLGTYPGAVFNPEADSFVHGEIYFFPEPALKNQKLLRTLDDYEGDEYDRILVPVQTANGFIQCWTYVFNQPTESFPRIFSGRFFR
ncbi:gamma-glutamylcyclotransferase family protein [Larkinella rosea]|uniref:Gamma-glutamylcyclotransferase n=1 Tax=Larkinella rosea TaxID=2025312 RepID=A0A3P1BCU4_9BACT|nr:gamma-glutamylcyclotransferase family protein [Larkinella rosea]RRA98592.1 gamma-glutamylcyclotransferase [Larkinella rosea]